MSDERQNGMVKSFNEAKGYGFITPADGSPDLFVHFSGIAGAGLHTLEEGQQVSFIPKKGKKGMQAEDVQVY